MAKIESSSQPRVVIVGGGYAGVLAALRASRRLRGRASIVLIDGRDALVERVRLHEAVACGRVIEHSYAKLLRGSGVRFVRGWVQSIDTARRRVVLADEALEYDRLLLALGSAVAREAVPGVAEHALALDPDRGAELHAKVASVAERRGRVVVCGGGLSGVEMAAELAEVHPGLEVTLVTQGELGAMISVEGREYLRAASIRLGVRVREHVTIERVEAGALRCADERIEFDVCIWAAGFVASPLLRAAGLRVDARGQALVDPQLRALEHEAVFVAGDAARIQLPQDPHCAMAMGCKTAMPMAAHASDNLAASLLGRPLAAFDFADPGLCISLGRRDGLIQTMPGGHPGGVRARGRLAAWIKERICRYTIHALAWQRIGVDYRWLKSGRAATVSRGEPIEALSGGLGS
ncbi:NAD(P)/FAD-dependent oxidoreductase [Nannocystaceae bacterium ST9]